MSICWKGAGILFAAMLGIVSRPSLADEMNTAFYRDQIVRLVVGFPTAGPNDTLARLIARLLPAQIPGGPRVIVQNMPGAGSMKAVEFLALQAPRDGTVFGSISTTVIMQSIMGPGNDLVARLQWLGSAEAVTRVCFAYRSSGVSDLGVVRTRGGIVGASSVGSPTSDHARLLKRAFGDKIKIVYGYAGSGDLLLAMERGEIEAVCGMSINTVRLERPDWYAQGRLIFLIRFSDEPRGEAWKLPSYTDLLPSEERDAAAFLLRQDAFARAFVMPPGIPPARFAAFRAAFEATLDAPEFRVEVERAGGEHAPLRGADMARMIAQMRAADPKLKERARSLLADP